MANRETYSFSELGAVAQRASRDRDRVPGARLTGVACGKILPREKFTEDRGMRLPLRHHVGMGVTGEFPLKRGLLRRHQAHRPGHAPEARSSTVRIVPWASDPTAQVIHDCYNAQGQLVSFARARCCATCATCSPRRAGSRWLRPSSSSTWWPATPTRHATEAAGGPQRRAGNLGRPTDRCGQRVRPAVRRMSTTTARRWA